MKKASIAVCGTGYWGKNLAKNFRELGVLKVICDKRAEVTENYAKIYPEIRLESDFSKVLSDDSINAVVIALPTPLHYEFAKKALLAGKNVFVEKPIALSVKHAEDLCRIAKKSKLKLMVGHLLLYHPAVVKLKQIIHSKEFGEVYYLYTQRLNLGQIRKDENALWSLAPHDISVILELFNKKPLSVSAHGHSYVQKARGIEDVIFMNFTFKDGKSAHIHISWLDPHKVRKITLVGSKQMVVFDDMETSEKIKIFDKGVDHDQSLRSNPLASSMVLRVGEVHAPMIENIEPLRVECQHFIDCIEKNLEPKSNGQNGLDVLNILHAATESIKKGGKTIRL